MGNEKIKINISYYIKLQEQVSKRVRFRKIEKVNRFICLDVGYKGNFSLAVGVLYDVKKSSILNVYLEKSTVNFPYIPGFLFLREAKVLLKLLNKVKEKFDLIIVDGQGLSHPRKAGLATFVGVYTNKPTIGIAKGYLFGKIVDNVIYVDNLKVGYKMKNYYVSIGSNIDFDSLIKFLKSINFEYPKAMKVADKLSSYLAKKLL